MQEQYFFHTTNLKTNTIEAEESFEQALARLPVVTFNTNVRDRVVSFSVSLDRDIPFTAALLAGFSTQRLKEKTVTSSPLFFKYDFTNVAPGFYDVGVIVNDEIVMRRPVVVGPTVAITANVQGDGLHLRFDPPTEENDLLRVYNEWGFAARREEFAAVLGKGIVRMRVAAGLAPGIYGVMLYRGAAAAHNNVFLGMTLVVIWPTGAATEIDR